jgi:hypothetical protein
MGAIVNPWGAWQIGSMPVPFDLMRAVLALLGVFFAVNLGRGATRAYERRPRPAWRGWLIRLVLTLLAVSFRRGLDAVTVAALVLSAAAIAGGAWLELRPRKPEEDLTSKMFGEN